MAGINSSIKVQYFFYYSNKSRTIFRTEMQIGNFSLNFKYPLEGIFRFSAIKRINTLPYPVFIPQNGHYNTNGLNSEVANLPGGKPFSQFFSSYSCAGCTGLATRTPSAIYVIVIISLRLSLRLADV